MRLPISWLNEYVDVKNISEKTLCDALVGAGFEVEEIIRYSDDISGVDTLKLNKEALERLYERGYRDASPIPDFLVLRD